MADDIINNMIALPTLKTGLDEEAWRKDALCRGKGSDLYFLEGRGGANHYSEIKRSCLECPVRIECLNFAIDNSIAHGLWGGMSYRERLAYQRHGRPALAITTKEED